MLSIQDLFDENLIIIRRGWNGCVDALRDDIEHNHPQIKIVDFSFYDVNVFNQREHNKDVLITVGNWENVHPLLKVMPADWGYLTPFGILYSPTPSDNVLSFIHAVSHVFGLEK